MFLVRYLACMALTLWLFNLCPAFGQEKEKALEKPWTGRLADGRLITEADLDQILQEQKLWKESDGKKGKRANLRAGPIYGQPI